jgi:hypothetical protein
MLSEATTARRGQLQAIRHDQMDRFGWQTGREKKAI